MTHPAFQPEVIDALRELSYLNPESLLRHCNWYVENWKCIAGAPAPIEFPIADAELLQSASSFNPMVDVDWTTFKAARAEEKQREQDKANPFLPRWASKAEENANPWLNDTGHITDLGQDLFDGVIRSVSPNSTRPLLDQLYSLPIEDIEFLGDCLEAMKGVLPLFVWSMGDSDKSDFRWSAALCILAGLGLPCVRIMAHHMAQDHEDWGYWANCTDEELLTDLLQAHKSSGYPFGLLRLPYKAMMQALEGQAPMRDGCRRPQAPQWMAGCAAMHVIKHARLGYAGLGEYYVSVMFEGKHQRIPVLPGQLHQPLAAGCNKALCAAICSTLRIPYNGKSTGTEWYHEAASRAMAYMHPSSLPRIKAPDDLALMVKGPVTMLRPCIVRDKHAWLNTGLTVEGVADINLDTGVVNAAARIGGSEVIMRDWMVPDLKDHAYYQALWRRNMPKHVPAELGGTTIRRLVKNINDLGYPKAWAAVIDATLVCDLLRRQLGDCQMTEALSREFPLLYILPSGSKESETSNQGKTTLGRIFAGVIAPGLTESVVSGDTGAPAQRSVASPIEQYGTGFYDEFILPRDQGHLLAAGQLSSLATGGKAHPGKAMENSDGVQLKHPLILCGKLSPDRTDIRNRASPTFMDQITDETRLSGADYDALISGVTPLRVRLAYQRFIKEHNLVERFRDLPAHPNKTWRWSGHMAAALLLYMLQDPAVTMEEAEKDIEAYINASLAKMSSQLTAADEGGLSELLNVKVFDFTWYLSNLDSLSLDRLVSDSKKQPIAGSEAIRKVVEGEQVRRLNSELKPLGISEKAAIAKVLDTLQKGPIVAENGYSMELVPGTKSVIFKAPPKAAK